MSPGAADGAIQIRDARERDFFMVQRNLQYTALKIDGIWESSTEESDKWHKKLKAMASGFAPNKKAEIKRTERKED